MFTNGSGRSTTWWKDLAKTVDLVHFSIDGLEDTNAIYRRGTHFPTILNSIQAYIGSGGTAVWDYIVFRHNEHQVQEARQLAGELGFQKFNLKKTGRFFSNVKMQSKDRQVVYDNQGQVEYFLEMPEDRAYQNGALAREEALVEKYGSLENYLDRTPILCKVDREKSVYISSVGHVFPCCWTANPALPLVLSGKKILYVENSGAATWGARRVKCQERKTGSYCQREFFSRGSSRELG